jgi:hypothetical protein
MFEGFLETGKGTEREAQALLSSCNLEQFLLPTKSVLPIVLKSDVGRHRLKIVHPHVLREIPKYARPANMIGHAPKYIREYDWASLPNQVFQDKVLGLDLVYERQDGTVIGFDVTAHKADSEKAMEKQNKLTGLKSLLKEIGIDSVVVLSLDTGDYSFNVLPKEDKLALISKFERKIAGLSARKWVRTWELKIS